MHWCMRPIAAVYTCRRMHATSFVCSYGFSYVNGFIPLCTKIETCIYIYITSSMGLAVVSGFLLQSISIHHTPLSLYRGCCFQWVRDYTPYNEFLAGCRWRKSSNQAWPKNNFSQLRHCGQPGYCQGPKAAQTQGRKAKQKDQWTHSQGRPEVRSNAKKKTIKHQGQLGLLTGETANQTGDWPASQPPIS